MELIKGITSTGVSIV